MHSCSYCLIEDDWLLIYFVWWRNFLHIFLIICGWIVYWQVLVIIVTVAYSHNRAAYKGFADTVRLLLFRDASQGRQDKEGIPKCAFWFLCKYAVILLVPCQNVYKVCSTLVGFWIGYINRNMKIVLASLLFSWESEIIVFYTKKEKRKKDLQ